MSWLIIIITWVILQLSTRVQHLVSQFIDRRKTTLQYWLVYDNSWKDLHKLQSKFLALYRQAHLQNMISSQPNLFIEN